MKNTLKNRLIRYLKSNVGWHPSITLQKLTLDHGAGTGRTAVRRLQEATEEGILEVSYVRGAAQYRFKRQNPPEHSFGRSSRTPTSDLHKTLSAMDAYWHSIPIK